MPNRAAETAPPAELEVLTEGKSGSDFMIDCIKSLGFEYMAANPASSFRGLHESLVNYGGNKNPEFLTCSHEEISVAMGTAITRSKASRCACSRMAPSAASRHHGAVQFMVRSRAGLHGDRQHHGRAERRPGIEWNHSAQDPAAVVRDFRQMGRQSRFVAALRRSLRYAPTRCA
jgi:hypothetical protein